MKHRYKKQGIINKQLSILNTHYTQCSSCLKHSKQMSHFPINQASGCASDIYWSENKDSYLIASSYGSDYDTSLFIVKDMSILNANHYSAFSFIKTNPKKSNNKKYMLNVVICDHCISKFLKEEKIEEDKTYNYWEPLEKMNRLHDEDPDLYFKLISAGSSKCIELIEDELAKPPEQRLKEREERDKNQVGNKLIIRKHEKWF